MRVVTQKPEPKVHKGNGNAVKPPKFSLRRVWNVLEGFDIDLHDLNVSLDSGALTLAVDAIDLAKRNRLIAKLQKRAIPKSDWQFVRDEAWVYGNVSGRIVSLLVFNKKLEKVKP